MLVLSRKEGETIVLDGTITVRVLKVKGGGVQIGIDAPPQVRILRDELQRAQLPMIAQPPIFVDGAADAVGTAML